jgi:hypothetical protein
MVNIESRLLSLRYLFSSYKRHSGSRAMGNWRQPKALGFYGACNS